MAELLLELSERRDPGAHADARCRRSQAPGERRPEGRGHRRSSRRAPSPRRAGWPWSSTALPAARADVSEERRGPRVGAPDQAVQGFLKATGLASLDQAEKRDTGKGEFWFAVITKKGGPTAEALARHDRRRDESAALAQVDEVGQRHHDLGAPAAVHRRAVRRQGAEGRSGAGRPDGADRLRRHHARPSLPRPRARSRSRTSPTTPPSCAPRT